MINAFYEGRTSGSWLPECAAKSTWPQVSNVHSSVRVLVASLPLVVGRTNCRSRISVNFLTYGPVALDSTYKSLVRPKLRLGRSPNLTRLRSHTTASRLSKMANMRTCWTCCRKRLSAMLRPLFYLTICYLFSNIGALFHAGYLVDCLLYAAYYVVLLKLLIPILTLLKRSAWYDEDAPEDHCHYWDTKERMAMENQRMHEELAVMRGKFQAGVRQPFFPQWSCLTIYVWLHTGYKKQIAIFSRYMSSAGVYDWNK